MRPAPLPETMGAMSEIDPVAMKRGCRLLAGAVLLGLALVPGGRGGLVPGSDPGLSPASAAVRAAVSGDVVVTEGRVLQQMLDGLEPGQRLVIPEGVTVVHDRVVVVRVPGVTLAGGGRLEAREEARSALVVAADGVTIEGLTLATPHTTRRWEAPEQHRLVLAGARGVTVTGVTVEGSAASGIFVDGSHAFMIRDVTVSGTRADGIHITGGARHGRVDRARVVGSGDDGIAVVSYTGAPACRGITVSEPDVSEQVGGRGLSVVGGRDVTMRDIRVDGAPGASVYVASEGSYGTRGVNGVRIEGGVVSRSNSDPAIDHGAVLVYGGRAGAPVSDVMVRGLDVVGTAAHASAQLRVLAEPGGHVHRVRWRDIDVIGSPSQAYSVMGRAERVSSSGVRTSP